jgi:hypothetical protein
MRPAVWCLFCAAFSAFGGEVPEPLFEDTGEAFLEQLAEGQFDPHLELHLVQYAADPRWVQDWVRQRYSGTGLLVQAGSITSRNLFLDSAVAVNLFPTAATQVRYDRRRYDDGRFDQDDERFDLLFYPGPRWALALTGSPTPRKQEAVLGAGFRLGPQGAGNALEVRLMGDRWLWNQKTAGQLRFLKAPVRLLVDASLEGGDWRLAGTLNCGLPFRAEETGTAAAPRAAWGRRRNLEMAAELRRPRWEGALRLSARDQVRGQEGGVAGSMESTRSWARLLASARRPLGGFTLYGTAGISAQADRFAVPGLRDGSYRMRAGILGLEAGRQITPGFQLRLGLLGSPVTMERRGMVVPDAPEPGAALTPPGRKQRGWVGKAHLRALLGSGPRWSLECLISQTVGGGSFGGGSVKARFVL